MTDEAKEKWIEDNPVAVKEFYKLALQVANTGRKFGFRLIAEQIRWHRYFAHDPKDYKWSDNVTPYIGRKFIEQYPQFRNQVIIKGQNK